MRLPLTPRVRFGTAGHREVQSAVQQVHTVEPVSCAQQFQLCRLRRPFAIYERPLHGACLRGSGTHTDCLFHSLSFQLPGVPPTWSLAAHRQAGLCQPKLISPHITASGLCASTAGQRMSPASCRSQCAATHLWPCGGQQIAIPHSRPKPGRRLATGIKCAASSPVVTVSRPLPPSLPK